MMSGAAPMKTIIRAACGHTYEIQQDDLGTAGECPECGCIDSELGSYGVWLMPEKGDTVPTEQTPAARMIEGLGYRNRALWVSGSLGALFILYKLISTFWGLGLLKL